LNQYSATLGLLKLFIVNRTWVYQRHALALDESGGCELSTAEDGIGGGGGIGLRARGLQSLACLRCCFSIGFSGVANSASAAGSDGYSFGISAAATFSNEEDSESFASGGGGGRSVGAWGRAGGVSRGRIGLGLTWLGGERGGRLLLPGFTLSGGGDEEVGGFGAGIFLETRRKTLGFPATPNDDPTLLDPTVASNADDELVDAGKLSAAFGTRTGSGCTELTEGTGEVRPARLVMMTVDGIMLTKLLVFCGVLVAEPLSLSPDDNNIQTLL